MSWKRYKEGKKAQSPRVKDKLAGLEVKPSKSRGQNFIIDPLVLDSIVEFGAPKNGNNIIEIGPGLGALTERLLPYGNLSVIEIEGKFCSELRKKHPALKVIQSDVREVDFVELGKDLLVFGNLPYSFSTDIIFHLVAFADSIDRAVLMLQREFAERLGAEPGGRSYGVLSISCQLSANVRLGPIIGGDSFHPPTEVESRLVELTFPRTPKFKVEDVFWVKRVVSAAFTMRRKMIKNTLKGSQIVPGDAVDRALERVAIDPRRRPETLSIPEFIALSEALQLERST